MRRDLVEAARRGDHEAFEVLATAAGDRLYGIAFLVGPDEAVARSLLRGRRRL